MPLPIEPNKRIRAEDFIFESERQADPADDYGRVPKLEENGYLNKLFITPDLFGNGADGDVTVAVATTTTLTRDMFYNNLTVNGTLVTNGWRIFVKGTISGTGTIQYPDPAENYENGNVNGFDYTGFGLLRNTPGSAPNGSQVFGTNAPKGRDHTIGSGNNTGGEGVYTLGDNYFGGLSGDLVATTPFPNHIEFNMLNLLEIKGDGLIQAYRVAGAPAGGRGSRGGGGGGASGGLIFIMARVWAGTFTLRAIGAKGSQGQSYASVSDLGGSSTGGGGGCGGHGGYAIVIYMTKTWTGSTNFAGGAGGAGGRSGTGAGGTAGSAGADGGLYEVQALTIT